MVAPPCPFLPLSPLPSSHIRSAPLVPPTCPPCSLGQSFLLAHFLQLPSSTPHSPVSSSSSVISPLSLLLRDLINSSGFPRLQRGSLHFSVYTQTIRGLAWSHGTNFKEGPSPTSRSLGSGFLGAVGFCLQITQSRSRTHLRARTQERRIPRTAMTPPKVEGLEAAASWEWQRGRDSIPHMFMV